MGQIYNHLCTEERNFIQRHLNLGQSCRWIAGRLKRSPPTIVRRQRQWHKLGTFLKGVFLVSSVPRRINDEDENTNFQSTCRAGRKGHPPRHAEALFSCLNNYAAHKHAEGRGWLDRHPRFTFHFTPTSCSWLNAVEGFFAKLTERRIKRGVFHSVLNLKAAINRFVAENNKSPSHSPGPPSPIKSSTPSKRAPSVRISPLGFTRQTST